MKLSEWLQENELLLHILVTRHFGQWGFECQLISHSDAEESKESFLQLVTGDSNAGGKYPSKAFMGFGVRKFESIENLIEKASGKTFCYADGKARQQIIEFPGGLSAGEKEDYKGLVKGDNPDSWE
ncbi:MAG: hypothetical protein CMQ38_10035 [Gammaproteobacteria bacterium]|nr:hypothetical protein [Gammaproteobacteria bacterium]|tara:strand:+ start:724 stop:1101 length:378 start_codon:yes stop_codon:yes gene_type:complete